MLALGLLVLLAPLPRVREIDLRLDSPPAAPGGVAVRLALPEHGRYADGAPVIVHVEGGWGPGGVTRIQAPLARYGFLEVRFAFPGGGPAGTGGEADLRGPGSVRVLADVLAYAAGLTRDRDGLTLAERAAPLTVLVDQVGVIGWSNGGNTAIVALAEHRAETRRVAWLATWESPLGDGAATALCGGHRDGPNPAYDPATGALDLSRLRWDPNLSLRLFGGGRGPAGALYFDANANGRADEREVVPAALPAPTPGAQLRFAYPLSLVREAQRSRLLEPWPEHLLGPGEAAEFWAVRDGAGRLLEAAAYHPDLIVMVLGTDRDHVQVAADHPHLFAAYDGWRRAECRWLRLNPDAAYLAAVTGTAPDGWTETVAGLPLTRRALPTQLLPADRAPAPILGLAAALELADRVHAGTVAPDLETPLEPVAPQGPR